MRTFIQYGTSLCYPLSAQSCHVSVCPNHQCGRVTPFDARADIAHLGATGYELDTTKLGKEDLLKVKEQVEKYKGMEDLVLNGDLYRLNNPLEENLFAEMMVAKDKSEAHITVMRPLCRPNGECIRIYPQGLDEQSVYSVAEEGITKSGATLMNVGLIVDLPSGDFQTRTFTLKKV
jgi:alpha-galactosidase